MVDAKSLDAGTPRTFEASRFGAIGNDDRDGGVEASVTNGVDQRLKVAASSRDEDAEAPVNGVGGHFKRTASIPRLGIHVA